MRAQWIATLLLASPAAAWTPTILPRYDVHNNPDAIDFRRAGFVETGRAWARWNREVIALAVEPGDNTARIQAALDQVGAGGGGTVRLGPGTWRINFSTIHLQHDGVRLEGAGPARTILYAPGTRSEFTTLIMGGISNPNTWVGSQSYPDSWVRQGTLASSEFLAQDAAANSRTIRVDSPSRAVGDSIIVTGTPTAAFIAEHSMTGVWTTSMDYPAYLRTITAVLPDGYELDLPVRYPLKVRDQARIFPPTKIVRDLALSGFQILHDRHPGTDFDTGTPAAETTAATAIQFINVENGLVEDLYIPILPSRGIELAYSRHITVQRCSILESQNQNSNWNGYHFFVWGCDNIFRDNYSRRARRAFTPLMASCNGNVFFNNTSESPGSFPTSTCTSATRT